MLRYGYCIIRQRQMRGSFGPEGLGGEPFDLRTEGFLWREKSP
jgi:hypothetical protein